MLVMGYTYQTRPTASSELATVAQQTMHFEIIDMVPGSVSCILACLHVVCMLAYFVCMLHLHMHVSMYASKCKILQIHL